MTNTPANKKLNYLKMIKALYDSEVISLKRLKKLLKHFRNSQNPYLKAKKKDLYLELYLDDKICLELLMELHIFENNNSLKN